MLKSKNALNLILQGRREYQRPLWIAYVNLKAAFGFLLIPNSIGHYMKLIIYFSTSYSVDRPALWLLLHSLGIPLKIVDLIQELYTDMVSCVRLEGNLSRWF